MGICSESKEIVGLLCCVKNEDIKAVWDTFADTYPDWSTEKLVQFVADVCALPCSRILEAVQATRKEAA